MKILLVHPDDSVAVGTWAGGPWDLAVDLGWSGRQDDARQTKRLGFRVFSIYDLLDDEQHRSRIRKILALGLDHLMDSASIDWWDVFSAYPFQQLDQLMLLSALAEQIPEQAEIFVTRPHFMSRALSLLLNRGTTNRGTKNRGTKNHQTNGREIQNLSLDSPPSDRRTGFRARSHRYLKAASTLRPSQLIEIAFDKWDPDYRLRRHFGRSLKPSSTPAILLPSAYSNVSRAQVAYARMLPHRRFLLVVTRRNGRLRELPGNVEVRSLASYVPRPLPSIDEERTELLARWQELQNDRFETNQVLALARKLHVFDGFPGFLQHGLRVRDAWREVFAREPIASVLSADEHNPYTRLPILLAKSRKLRTVFCDHGALNMGFGIRRLCSDAYLVRGDMARDYSMGWCGLPASKIVVGGPSAAPNLSPASRPTERDWIVFYSEPYELSLGRTQTFYAELLPQLCLLARQVNRKVIVKLHPFESLRMRKALVDSVLSAEQRSLVEIREGPMAPDLFERAWFSLTVESSVAVESTANGVPCFLCTWFDPSWYGYSKQYAKYSAGYPLDSPQRIGEIPRLMEQLQVTEATLRNLQTPISPEHLESVLLGK